MAAAWPGRFKLDFGEPGEGDVAILIHNVARSSDM